MPPKWPSAFQPDVVREAFGERLTTYVLAVEAWRRGLIVSIRDARLRRVHISDSSGCTIRFIQSRPHLTTLKAHATAKNKHRSNELMAAAGLPVPRSVLIEPATVTAEKLLELAEGIGYPVVLKPVDGAMGQGVFSNIQDAGMLITRFEQLRQSHASSQLVLESHVPGDDYRILVFGGSYIAACLRVPANITGDGSSTVQELIDAKNLHRRKNPFLSKGLIKPDREITDYLLHHGYDLNSVPAEGEYIQLRGAANASAGGDVIDVSDQIPQHIQDAAVEAVKAVPGLHCAGVDVLYEGSGSEGEGRYAFLELNSQPQIGVNMYPTEGVGVDAPRKIIDVCFPESRRSDEKTDEQLCLNLRPALEIISSGHAGEVIMPPLPPSRYRSRLVYTFADPSTLTPQVKNRILRASREQHVAGFIKIRRGSPELMVAGTETQVSAFASAVHSISGIEPRDPRRWKGAVAAGFSIQN